MVRSMTGFGRAEELNQSYKLSVELRSVNHRYFDLSIKMPKKFYIFESAIRNELRQYINRGKVDLYISYESYQDSDIAIKYNASLAKQYMNYAEDIARELGIVNDMRSSNILRLPEVISVSDDEGDDDRLKDVLMGLLAEACKDFLSSRIKEGAALSSDIISKLDKMFELVLEIEKIYPDVLASYHSRLSEKINELLGNSLIDETRLVTEVAIVADKLCVDEEVVRLKSHMEATKSELKKGGNIGRKLDFIAQEMNREANTILSKSNNISISSNAIEIKTEIEKIREQIQNIE